MCKALAVGWDGRKAPCTLRSLGTGRGGSPSGHRERSQAGREAGRSAVHLQHVRWRRDVKWVWGTGQHEHQPYRRGGPQTGN